MGDNPNLPSHRIANFVNKGDWVMDNQGKIFQVDAKSTVSEDSSFRTVGFSEGSAYSEIWGAFGCLNSHADEKHARKIVKICTLDSHPELYL